MDQEIITAGELLEKARKLGKEERIVFEYFYKNVSVGDLRAVVELKRLGVKNPQEKIDELIDMGLLEKGLECYNLAKPLREYLYKRRV